jgi:hypothetical protein
LSGITLVVKPLALYMSPPACGAAEPGLNRAGAIPHCLPPILAAMTAQGASLRAMANALASADTTTAKGLPSALLSAPLGATFTRSNRLVLQNFFQCCSIGLSLQAQRQSPRLPGLRPAFGWGVQFQPATSRPRNPPVGAAGPLRRQRRCGRIRGTGAVGTCPCSLRRATPAP